MGTIIDYFSGNSGAGTGIEKTCENCTYEYTCDWSQAEGGSCCKGWKSDAIKNNEKEKKALNEYE